MGRFFLAEIITLLLPSPKCPAYFIGNKGNLFSGSAGVNSGRLLSRRPQACNRGPPKTPMTVRVKSGGGGGRKWSGGKSRPVYVANSLASGGSPRYLGSIKLNALACLISKCLLIQTYVGWKKEEAAQMFWTSVPEEAQHNKFFHLPVQPGKGFLRQSQTPRVTPV